MSTHREFVVFEDPRSPEAAERLIELGERTAEDMGAVRATFRAWPGRTANVAFAVLLVVAVATSVVAPNATELSVRLVIWGSFAFWVALFVAAGAMDRHRVCEHGLVVGFRTHSRYVVPWSTIDPGRVRVVRRPLLVGRRPELPASSPHYRVGWFTTSAVAVNGLDSAIDGWVRVPGLLGVTDAVELAGRARFTPFVWWLLGTQRPRELLEAIEAAMVADGYDARGLADRAERNAVTITWQPTAQSPIPPRYPDDPVVGVRGPDLP
ncbi:hypothetical protein [Cellulomonas sp. KH9]|uniref:hypothetical protein n=1 Tax=Cellulomonas sp. KH9 TaxID=1855324 RepID=UPI0008E94814|nr:hypothetical protein [Cellulomonas sp. KH9]SFJ62682.1 hypothetical protein SAMN05216467_0236 [Cellulomonas sp. KH9]